MADTHTITAHRLPVTFSASEVIRQNWLRDMYSMTPFRDHRCGDCDTEGTCYVIDSRSEEEKEIVWYTHFCGECGVNFEEPVD